MKQTEKQINRKYLPEGANIHYVDINNKYMAKAREAARASNDQQQPVGSVIVFNGEILDQDCNTTALVNPSLVKVHQKFCIRHQLGIPTGEHYWMCPGCASKKNHPEYKTCKRLVRKGLPKGDIDVYTWGHWAICSGCCEALEEANVKNFYLLENCEELFDPKNANNILGKQFKL